MPDVDALGDRQGVFDLDAEISDRAIKLGVAKQQLHRPNVASLPIDERRLGSA
jgi:hypothetical protein